MLKIAIGLYVLVTFSGLRGAELTENYNLMKTIESHLLYIHHSTTGIQSKLDKIMIENIQLYTETILMLDFIERIARSYFSSILVKELNKTRADVDAADAQGKDAEYCFRSAEREQKSIETAANKKLRECIERSIQRSVDDFFFTQNLFKDGGIIMNNLCNISTFCFSNITTARNCFKSEVEEAKVYVKQFDEKYEIRQKNHRKIYENIELHGLLCIGRTVIETKKKIAEWVFFTNSCVEGAE